ncbi:UbiA family prenyltransferase [Streptomyces sp. NBC_01614]|uniref:UbiA family prenyltransferase n=1 Tax=Streptomyces sp. NBC_01614 TaxID=2975897 RepID=UPI003865DDF6
MTDLATRGKAGRMIRQPLVAMTKMFTPRWRGSWFAHLQTWRPYTVWYAGLVGLAGGVLAGQGHAAAWLLAVAWGGPTLGWLAGHYLGDYFDRDLDAVSKPRRPIPSGRLSSAGAVTAGTLCLIGFSGLALAANQRSVVLVAAIGAGIVAYSRFFKARGLAGNVTRGALTSMAFVFGSMTVSPWPPLEVIAFAPAFWAHDTASNLIGTLRDVDGDRACGYHTMPVRRGVAATVRAAAGLYAVSLLNVAVVGSLLAQEAARPGVFAFLFLATGMGLADFMLLFRFSPQSPPLLALHAHEVLVLERLVLTGSLLALGMGLTTTVAMLAPVLLLSAVTQALMRTKHEGSDTPRRAL